MTGGAKTRLALMTAAVLAVGIVGVAALASDRAALWNVVRLCRADAALTGWAFPCLRVDTGRGGDDGYAVLRAPFQSTHVVVMPLVRIDGIEAPVLQASTTPNYVADAWAERRDIVDKAARPLEWDRLGLAINSFVGRSQDQLHIHVECVHADVRATLQARQDEVPVGRWTTFPVPLRGLPYQITRLNETTLAGVNIFEIAARGLSVKPDDMFNLSLALLGAEFADGSRGFYLLADLDRPGRAYAAHAEHLLDPACRP